MEQATFAELEHDSKKRRTRRELFLEKMDGLVPWEALEALIEPFYPRPGRGRRPYPLRTMLRVHCVQLWYDLSDPGMEDLLYEVESVRRFAGLRLSGPLPDETTILKFRHLLEARGLGEGLFEAINAHLADEGHSLRRGTIMDASIVDAPTSTKNAKRERDPEMHQTKKGNQWYFGMKAHIGVDAESGLAHSLATTPANESDVATAHEVLHGDEEEVHGDAGYQGVGKREENRDADVDWRVAMKPGKRRRLDKVGRCGVGGEAQGVGAGEGQSTRSCTSSGTSGTRKMCYRRLAKEHAADRPASRLREPADRGPLRRRLTREKCARNPPEGGESGAILLFSSFSGGFSPNRMMVVSFFWIPGQPANPGNPPGHRKRYLIRPSLALLARTRGSYRGVGRPTQRARYSARDSINPRRFSNRSIRA